VERLSTVATGSTSVRTLGFHGRLAVRLRGLAFDDWQRLGLELTFRNASATLAGVPAERIVNLQVSKRQRSCATPQATRGWARPPYRHLKTQSCCLGSAFEVTAFRNPSAVVEQGAHLFSLGCRYKGRTVYALPPFLPRRL
jgi:hypothetical protein